MPIAGARDTKVEIQSPTWSISSLGERSASFATVATEWANVRYLGGREKEKAQQIAAETDIICTVQYSSNTSGIEPDDRIKIGSKQYDILKLIYIPGGRPVQIKFYAKNRILDEAV